VWSFPQSPNEDRPDRHEDERDSDRRRAVEVRDGTRPRAQTYRNALARRATTDRPRRLQSLMDGSRILSPERLRVCRRRGTGIGNVAAGFRSPR
jgi:hypothetical protein